MRANYIQFLSFIVAGLMAVSNDVRAETPTSEFGDANRALRLDTIAEQYSDLDTPDLPGGGTSGACCRPDGGCTIEATQVDCESVGGVFGGEGSACTLSFCPPRCQAGGGGQIVDFQGHGSSNVVGAISDIKANDEVRIADRFGTCVGGAVTSVRWWGFYRDFGNFVPCNSPGGDSADDFTIAFYAPGDFPGATLAGPFSVTPTVVDTGRQVFGHTVFQYTATGIDFVLQPGGEAFLEIANHTTGNCSWLWSTADGGEGFAHQHQGDLPYGSSDKKFYDMAWCLNLPGVVGGWADCVPTGACCLGGGTTCINTMGIAACLNDGGTFLGFLQSCAPGICEGACCNSMTHTCTLESEVDCLFDGGDFQGIGSTCDQSPCGCATCPGDMTGNGAVDGEDIPAFVTCQLNGGAGCACGDMNGDLVVDLDDLSDFVATLINSTGDCP